MARRTDENQSIVDRGKLFKEFKNTEFYREIGGWLKEKIRIGTENVVELTIGEQYEKAKAEGHRVSAFREFFQFIEGGIDDMAEMIESEKVQKEYDSQIPRHVQ